MSHADRLPFLALRTCLLWTKSSSPWRPGILIRLVLKSVAFKYLSGLSLPIRLMSRLHPRRQPSKLPKVLKRIPLVEYDIPNEAKYRFKERSVALLNKWSQVLGGGEIAAATPVPASATTAEEKSSHISPDPPAAAVAAAAEEEATNGDTTVLTDVGDVSMAVNGAEADTKPAEEAAAAAAPAPAV